MLDLVTELSNDLNESLDASDAASSIVDPRTIPVRFSRLKHMAKSALHYWDACQSDTDDTMARRLGRGTHAMVLGEPVTCFNGRRVGKAWDLFKQEHAGSEILNGKEWRESEAMANAIKRHPIAAPLLFENAQLEQHIAWEWMGRECSSRPDSRKPGIVTDLKTTRCADPAKFAKDATWHGYHAQLAFYEMAVEHATGKAVDESYVVAVESRRPYAITVLKLTDAARDMGRRLCRAWMERLLVCEQSNSWQAYTESIAAFDVESEEFGITIDGVPFDEEEE